MKTVITASVLLLALAGSAQAQNASDGGAASPSTPGRQRAPLANPADLEPAVDVGEQRVALIDRPPAAGTTAPSSSAPAVSGATGAAPQSAAPSPTATTTAPIARSGAPSAAPKPATGGQAPNSRVLDTLDLGTTSITGNQELPKVLYIVPWKKSDLGDLVGRPVNTLLDEVLEPVDPEVFQRHLSYYEALYGKGQKERE